MNNNETAKLGVLNFYQRLEMPNILLQNSLFIRLFNRHPTLYFVKSLSIHNKIERVLIFTRIYMYENRKKNKHYVPTQHLTPKFTL